ncbi:putative flavoprotein involved in K+ transport [Herbihabitans rhizosphaerae]|uniref:Putative flavoprotein involved in K+ transport n=1 Tax=Herbihabitans rhizosphaerae TaxID=1872711 RepID=A0A4Q7KDA4_9PSEU|nr:NAD(P)/FAD-dependent oxidoreductase [Herbihabitans rhizosphaerae]RZS32175.1 putative flavoprotein involved in K+ transport [Herbihabitans rhizosphaerae]
MDIEYSETVVIGAGQQGCGVAAALQELGHESIVLERVEIGQAWAHERWDSLLVGSGNRSVRFPGWEYDGDDPDGLMSGPELARHLRRYVKERNLRVLQHTPVREVECPPDATDRDDVRFRTHLSTGGVVESRNLVAAMGGYANPRIPDLASHVDPSVNQMHSRDYRNPEALPDGSVLVVGAGISGQQIADELVDAGRDVVLSVGRHQAWPRRYRGRGLHDWMFVFSLYEDFVTPDFGEAGDRPLAGLPVTAVKDRGEDLNLGTLARKGVVLVGSTRAAEGDVLLLEDNVVAIAEASARSFQKVLDKIDTGIRQRGFVVPEQRPAPGVDMGVISNFGNKLDLVSRNITTIVWCTGFGPDYRILPDNALDEFGAPIQQKGLLGAIPGLYYAGLPDGNSLAPTAISANVENGRFIARQIRADHIMRSGSSERVM